MNFLRSFHHDPLTEKSQVYSQKSNLRVRKFITENILRVQLGGFLGKNEAVMRKRLAFALMFARIFEEVVRVCYFLA